MILSGHFVGSPTMGAHAGFVTELWPASHSQCPTSTLLILPCSTLSSSTHHGLSDRKRAGCAPQCQRERLFSGAHSRHLTLIAGVCCGIRATRVPRRVVRPRLKNGCGAGRRRRQRRAVLATSARQIPGDSRTVGTWWPRLARPPR